jgi:hypothetical protein
MSNRATSLIWRKSSQQVAKDEPAGQRYGLVVVLRRAPGLGGGARFLVRCDCGVERVVEGGSLRRRPPKSHRECQR